MAAKKYRPLNDRLMRLVQADIKKKGLKSIFKIVKPQKRVPTALEVARKAVFARRKSADIGEFKQVVTNLIRAAKREAPASIKTVYLQDEQCSGILDRLREAACSHENVRGDRCGDTYCPDCGSYNPSRAW